MNFCKLIFVLLLAYAHGQEKEEDEFSMFNINNEEDSDSVFSSDSDNSPTVMEGDIVVTPKLMAQIGEMERNAKEGNQMFDAIRNGVWPRGSDRSKSIIPYEFQPGSSAQMKSVVRQAAKHIEDKVGCISWREMSRGERRRTRYYVTFFRGRGCYSMIGRQARPQKISLGNGCQQMGTAVHEMMHAMGFFHEQSRLDRDRWISIRWSYIPSGLWYNFKKYQPGQADTLGEPYDKNSIMHYGNYAFSTQRGQMTIVSKSNSRESLGQRRGLSTIDIKQLKKYYRCSSGGGTKPTNPNPSTCTDSKKFCTLLRSYCSDKWVKTNCKKSCNQCGSVCKDTSTYAHNCPVWAKRDSNGGYCTSGNYKSWMRQHCKNSCKKWLPNLKCRAG